MTESQEPEPRPKRDHAPQSIHRIPTNPNPNPNLKPILTDPLPVNPNRNPCLKPPSQTPDSECFVIRISMYVLVSLWPYGLISLWP